MKTTIATVINGIEEKWDKNWYKMTGGDIFCPRPYYAKERADDALNNTVAVIKELGLNYYLREKIGGND